MISLEYLYDVKEQIETVKLCKVNVGKLFAIKSSK